MDDRPAAASPRPARGGATWHGPARIARGRLACALVMALAGAPVGSVLGANAEGANAEGVRTEGVAAEGAVAEGAAAEDTRVRTDSPPPSAPPRQAAAEARVILKYGASSPLLRQRAFAATPQVDRVRALGLRLGMALRTGTQVADRVEVVRASGMDSETLAARLAAEPDIEYAVPDRRQQHFAAPNDPLYTTGPTISGGRGGPQSGQWYLRAPSGEVQSGVDAEGAWDVTFGAPDTIVAVLDTGVLFDHPDMRRVSQGGNVLPGYDMISDVDIANDGDGRDADASDAGDWLTEAEATLRCGFPCLATDSSWHGTGTASVVGATTNDGTGMASVGRRLRILPVRVLGKGGGFDSDIIAGMRWATGLFVPGVPINPTPARVLNLSLGSSTACSLAYRTAVSEITAAGVLVVASAGNTAGHAVSTPANCPGVLGVAALRHVGAKVGFSDLGPEIGISAPGGNCVNIEPGQPCLFPIISATNSGTTTPVAGGHGYSDSFDIAIGTSFSAPMVAGTAALVFSARPDMSPAQVREVLSATARAFPTTGAEDPFQSVVPQCAAPAPIGLTQFDQLQCYCTTSTCGAGMLDAGAALRAASGVRARIATLATAAGAPARFDSSASVVGSGRSIASRRWQVVEGSGVALAAPVDAATVTLAAVPGGPFTLGLTVIDNAGARAYTERRFQPGGDPAVVLDVDGDGRVGALTDGVLVLRFLFGFTGAALIEGALDPAATRTDPAELQAHLGGVRAQLDADGSGNATPLVDGVLIARFMFGFDGDALIFGALSGGATRTTAAAVRGYLQTLTN